MDPAFVRGFLESTLAQPVSPALMDTMLQDALQVPAHVWQAAWKGRLEQGDFSGELEKINVPTLLIWGDQDERCSRDHQDRFDQLIADTALLVYSGAGHGLPAETTARLAADLVAFINDRLR
jgi:pimeloyl-ACP methyl ester carboxylesterase